MAKPQITLYLDTVSPFAYMAYYVVRNSPVFKECEINYVPIFLGGVMKATGNRAPLEIKNKDKWIELERLRWAKQFNTQRALCALSQIAPEKVPDAIAALYHAFWVEGQKIEKPDVIEAVLGKAFTSDLAKRVMEATTSTEVKQLLIANTEKAVKDGAFGLPWFVATNSKGEKECFWGFDHLGQVVDHLGLEKPKAESGGWKSML
ncbi:2-hydroxychromene-2-carboxylate isomerase [Lasallia pustulata]|uniref:Glutathione S-transferase kappa n=1 Tax=Lasallia pustulata TaxID=136370 RepID=A0A1W5CUD6_9LECA|nr:2-hydroxychromene-2-carboxylate isomerase [Lasallia pustulata]